MTDTLWSPETGPSPAPDQPETGQSADPGLIPPPRVLTASWPPLDAQRRHCRQPGCRCTHDNGCEFGWVDTGVDRVVPCPICRPDKVQIHTEDRDAWLARLRRRR